MKQNAGPKRLARLRFGLSCAGRMPHAQSPSQERILRAIADIYAAVGNSDRWKPCLASISELLGGIGANLLHFDHQNHEAVIAVTARTDPAAFETYTQYFHGVDPWGRRVRPEMFSAERVLLGQSLIAHEEVKRTEFYADFGRHYNITRSMIGVIEPPSTTASAIITINGGDQTPEFTADSARLLEVLLPHLRRALTLHRQLAGVNAMRSALTDVADRVSSGLILFDEDLSVLLVNRAGSQILALRDGIVLDDGALRTSTANATSALRRALQDATAVTAGRAIEAPDCHFTVPRASGCRSFQVVVTSVRRTESHDRTSPAAALWIKDPEQALKTCHDILRQRFGLTPTETISAVAIAEGKTIKEMAASMQHTEATARWYVKQVLAKTGASSRAEGASLILRILP
jgi:DNA-binding CsgD family transcriptional regulator